MGELSVPAGGGGITTRGFLDSSLNGEIENIKDMGTDFQSHKAENTQAGLMLKPVKRDQQGILFLVTEGDAPLGGTGLVG